jgi:hypothetical protein
LVVWLPTTKSQKSTRPWCVQVECDTHLESSQGELQVCFIPHLNRRFEQRVMTSQSPRNPNRDNFGTPPWESWDKKSFKCGCRKEAQSILYGGRWWLPPSPGRGESNESRVGGVGESYSSLLLLMMKVMIWHFVNNTHKVMITIWILIFGLQSIVEFSFTISYIFVKNCQNMRNNKTFRV